MPCANVGVAAISMAARTRAGRVTFDGRITSSLVLNIVNTRQPKGSVDLSHIYFNFLKISPACVQVTVCAGYFVSAGFGQSDVDRLNRPKQAMPSKQTE